MVPMIVLTGENCAYCKKAKMLIKRALEKNPNFSKVELSYLEETSPEGKVYPHHYIPAFICNNKLLFEGNPSMQDIEFLFSHCLKRNQ
jgi:protein-disulfide isomerase